VSDRRLGALIIPVVQAICVVIVTVAIVRHEFFSANTRQSIATTKLSQAQWRGVLAGGHWMGSPKALVTVVEFGDFQCPACRVFSTVSLRGVRAKYGDSVGVLFRHWPLAYHEHAYAAARASECVAAEGSFERFFDAVYDKQDSLGLRPIEAFARDAGVQDSSAFATCNASKLPVEAIEVDRKEALSLHGSGTPTIIVNGVQLGGVPDSIAFDELVGKALKAAIRNSK
jgi:protein-disulfide isomerase